MHNLHIFINTFFTIDKTEMHGQFQIYVKKKNDCLMDASWWNDWIVFYAVSAM